MRIHVRPAWALAMMPAAIIVASAVGVPPSAAHAQQRDTTVFRRLDYPVPLKDPGLGAVLSFIVPGTGQMYAGRVGKGVFLFAASVIGATMIRHTCDTDIYGRADCQWRLFPGAFMLVGAWGAGILTAPADVQRYNEQMVEDVRRGQRPY